MPELQCQHCHKEEPYNIGKLMSIEYKIPGFRTECIVTLEAQRRTELWKEHS